MNKLTHDEMTELFLDLYDQETPAKFISAPLPPNPIKVPVTVITENGSEETEQIMDFNQLTNKFQELMDRANFFNAFERDLIASGNSAKDVRRAKHESEDRLQFESIAKMIKK